MTESWRYDSGWVTVDRYPNDKGKTIDDRLREAYLKGVLYERERQRMEEFRRIPRFGLKPVDFGPHALHETQFGNNLRNRTP